MADSAVFEFGSRLGSWLALGFFTLIFSMIGAAVGRTIRARRTARAAGALIVAVPLALIYWTSIAGFYELELNRGAAVLRHLHPGTERIPLGEIASVQAMPAFKGRWRLRIVRTDGRQYDSATAGRAAVEAAARKLRTQK